MGGKSHNDHCTLKINLFRQRKHLFLSFKLYQERIAREDGKLAFQTFDHHSHIGGYAVTTVLCFWQVLHRISVLGKIQSLCIAIA